MCKDKITKEIRKYVETNGNEDRAYQNLGDAAKAVLRWEHSCVFTHLKKKDLK